MMMGKANLLTYVKRSKSKPMQKFIKTLLSLAYPSPNCKLSGVSSSLVVERHC